MYSQMISYNEKTEVLQLQGKSYRLNIENYAKYYATYYVNIMLSIICTIWINMKI